MNQPGKFRALLATLRIANAPSVVSNVFLGYLLGWAWENRGSDIGGLDWMQAGLLCLAGLLLYFSGNLANDWFDRGWDATRRPERALPAGLFSPSAYLVFALLLPSAGTIIASIINPPSGYAAVTICVLITIYTVFHKRSAWAVVPMGLCRAGLYFLGVLAWWPDLKHLEETGYLAWMGHSMGSWGAAFLAIPACLGAGLLCYIAGLSLSARYEALPDAPRQMKIISIALLVVTALAMSCGFAASYPAFAITGLLPYAVWMTLCLTRFQKPVPNHVSALLAGIPLVDLVAATPLALGLDAGILLVIPVSAFILGRALQKLAPAT